MIALALIIAAGTLVAGAALALAARRLPSARLQLAVFAGGAALLPLAAVLAAGALMFDSGHDLTVLAVGVAGASVAVLGAAVLSRAALAPLDGLRAASTAMAGGDLGARAPQTGPTEIAELARSFNAMAEHLEELFDARRQLVAWASHDLRTPLASLQAMLEAVEDGLAEPDDYLPAMRDQVRSLGRLIDDLFELARVDSGALRLELRDAGLDAVVRSCIRGAEAEALARHVHLEAQIAAGAPAARCAPEVVERVIDNLVRNALRHTPSDGAVAVVLEPADEAVRVSVEDSGEGLGAEALRRMFDHFWRADRARVADGGAGLGLAIARGLVEAQGGRIWAENRHEGGARVCFTLPAARLEPGAARP